LTAKSCSRYRARSFHRPKRFCWYTARSAHSSRPKRNIQTHVPEARLPLFLLRVRGEVRCRAAKFRLFVSGSGTATGKCMCHSRAGATPTRVYRCASSVRNPWEGDGLGLGSRVFSRFFSDVACHSFSLSDLAVPWPGMAFPDTTAVGTCSYALRTQRQALLHSGRVRPSCRRPSNL